MNPLIQLEYVITLGLAIGILAVVAAWRSSAGTRSAMRIVLLCMRISAVALGTALLLNPGHWQPQRLGRERQCLVLLDRSASMAVRDAGDQTRWEAAATVAKQLANALPADCPARILPFSTRLEEAVAPGDSADLHPDGSASDLVGGIESALARYVGGDRDAIAIALLSDGRQTPPALPGTAADKALSLGIPIITLGLGREVRARDLSLTPLQRQVTAFVGQQFQVGARLTNAELGDVRIEAELLDAAGKVLAKQTVLIADNTTRDVLFNPTPQANAGRVTYTLRVPEWPEERSIANNRTQVTAAVFDQPIRVLLTEGTPHWDSKFLAQVLRDQANMVVTENYRISEGRYHRIHSGKTELLEGESSAFPADPAALRKYDILVFGKGMEYFVDSRRAEHIAGFVRDHGGCIVFARACPWYREIPRIAALSPVTWGRSLTRPGRWYPSEDGERLQLFGARLPGRDDPIWAALPELAHLQTCESVHGFAHVLAQCVRTSETVSRSEPLIVSRRFGRGLSVAVNAEQLWHWDFFAAEGRTKQIYQAFWPQLVEWALTSSEFLPGQEYSLRVTPALVRVGEPLRVTVGRRRVDAENAERSSLSVVHGGRVVRRVPLFEDAPGRTHCNVAVTLDEPGLYDLLLLADSHPNSAPSQVVEVQAPPGEDEEFSADPAFLSELSAQTGGKLCSDPDELLEAIMSSLAPRDITITHERKWAPLWDRGFVLAAILTLLTLEWYLRRRNALA